MLKFSNWVMVESVKDITDNQTEWDKKWENRLFNFILPSDFKTRNDYPLYMRHGDDYCAAYTDFWFVKTKEEFKAEVDRQIVVLKEQIDYYEQLSKKLAQI